MGHHIMGTSGRSRQWGYAEMGLYLCKTQIMKYPFYLLCFAILMFITSCNNESKQLNKEEIIQIYQESFNEKCDIIAMKFFVTDLSTKHILMRYLDNNEHDTYNLLSTGDYKDKGAHKAKIHTNDLIKELSVESGVPTNIIAEMILDYKTLSQHNE